jgi:hypothetical protein
LVGANRSVIPFYQYALLPASFPFVFSVPNFPIFRCCRCSARANRIPLAVVRKIAIFITVPQW